MSAPGAPSDVGGAPHDLDTGRRWRRSRRWALLGPSVVLFVEVASGFVLFDALGADILPDNGRGAQAVIAATVLVLILAAQLSAAAASLLDRDRQRVAGQRRVLEQEQIADLLAHPDKAVVDVRVPPRPGLPTSAFIPSLIPLRGLPLAEGPDWPWRIIVRFRLSPSWAFSVLDDDVGLPAARAINKLTKLADARWAGHITACVAGTAALALVLVRVGPLPTKILLGLGVGLLLTGQVIAATASGRGVLANEA